MNFHKSTQKSEKLYFDEFFFQCFSQNISLELCVMTPKGDAKLKGKLTRGLKNDIRSLVNFHANSRKSEN